MTAQRPDIVNGTIDLSHYDFYSGQAVNLNGTWEFYPYTFLKPGADSTFSKFRKININVPKLWDTFVFDNNKKPNYGFGTYKLNIILPPDIDQLALRFKRIESAYSVFLNDSMVLSVGSPGDSPNTSIPSQKTTSVFFPVNSQKITLLISVSNYHHRKGGIDDAIFLGLPQQINVLSDKAKFYEWFMIGVILIMAVFYLGLWLYSLKKYEYLFFGLMLLSEIISIFANGEVLLTSFFPDLSWSILKKIDYISNFLRITFFAWFFYILYKQYIYKLFVQILSGINIILSGIVLFSELNFYSFTLQIFIVSAGITFLYIVIAQVRSIAKKRQGAVIPFIGTLILFLTAVNDILFVSDIIQTTYLIPFGLFVFIFTQSYLLSFEFSNLYKTEDELNIFVTETDNTKNKLLEIKGFDSSEILKIINDKTGASRSILFALNNNKLTAQVEFPASSGNHIDLLEDHVNEAFNSQKPVFINNLNNELAKNNQLKSILCCPLMKGEKIAGVLYLENKEKKYAFSSKNYEFISNLSDQIIGLHENNLIYKALENINTNLEDIIKKRTKDIRNQQELLEEQKNEITAIKNQLTKNFEDISSKNKIITENINFAKLIQKANLPDENQLIDLFPEHFILFKPKEIIGGDFYWAKSFHANDSRLLKIFAVADCTGHGVPGTLMSVIGNYLLNHIVSPNLHKPSDILNTLQKNINLIFEGENKEDTVKDGMDIALICYDTQNNCLEYAGAKIDLILARNGKLEEFKADRISIGAGQKINIAEKQFQNHKINTLKNDIVYLFTDGFQDQFGGDSDTRFMKNNFRQLLLETSELQISIQRSRLLKALNRWQGENIQNDDILVTGIKF